MLKPIDVSRPIYGIVPPLATLLFSPLIWLLPLGAMRFAVV